MTKYYPYGVSLSKGQLEKLSRAYNNNSAITIRLARNELSGPHELMLPKTQINKLRKAMSQGTGSDIKISKTQIRKAVRQGGSLGIINQFRKQVTTYGNAISQKSNRTACNRKRYRD